MKQFLVLFILVFTCNLVSTQTVDEQVENLLSLMTLEEKVGQMTQVERNQLNIQDLVTYKIGSILSGGGSSPSPNTIASWSNMYDSYQSVALQTDLAIPMIYGIDAVHGHNNVYGAVIFPHNIGMGCTWNPELITTANQIIAKEVAATGIDWTFAPCIAVPRNERWGRTYEGFGETAEIQSIMAEASVIGLQGSDLSLDDTILACAKHFVGDGGTIDGIDQGNTVLSEEDLRAIHMSGYIDAINAGVGSIMASFNSWNGVKLHGHDYLLTDVLKTELGFEGFVVSDWKGVDQIDENYREAIKRAINAGIDMVMVPDRYNVFIPHLISLVNDNEVSISRIDDAVRRILRQKFLLNLFNEPFADEALVADFGSQAHRDIARQVVRESMVLLNAKNDVLPLQKNNQTILVAGELANDLGAQCGGWTISWEGSNGNITIGTTILEGLQDLIQTSQVIYSPDGSTVLPVDVAVVVIGEKTPYAEGAGDRVSLDIDESDITLLKELKEEGIPTIAVLVSGRPMIISELLPYTDAIFAAWYPGTEGDGIAEVLFGDYLPTGKLTHSWPTDMSQIPINYGDANYLPLYEYLGGLQSFPNSTTNTELLPYAATTSNDGNLIYLNLTDTISVMNAINSDFEVYINDILISNLVSNVSVSNTDSSILVLTLNSPIQPLDKVLVSYQGQNVSAGVVALEMFNDFYVFNNVVSTGAVVSVPGKVEAELFFDMYGIQTESCADVGGGTNVGYIEPGDWLDYNINVTQSGLYRITSRISGYADGILSLNFNNTSEVLVNYSSTNGWQNWQDFSVEITLNAGLNTMRAIAQNDGFNINYFNFELLSLNSNENNWFLDEVVAYPNPFDEELNVQFTNSFSKTVSIKLFDFSGKLILDLFNGNVNQGDNYYKFSLDTTLSSGIYLLEIKDENKRYFKKIIKK